MSNSIKFENLPNRVQLLLYLKVSFETNPKAVFCTSNKGYLTAANQLIKEGLIAEIEWPGSTDRAFELTSKGKEHMNIK